MKTAAQNILIELSNGNIIRDRIHVSSYNEVTDIYLDFRIRNGVERIGTNGTWIDGTYYAPSMIQTVKREGEVSKGTDDSSDNIR